MRKFEDIVKELAGIEMDSSSHDDEDFEYNSQLDFYLSNVEKDSYVNSYLVDDDVLSKEEREAYGIEKIRDAVREYIISYTEA